MAVIKVCPICFRSYLDISLNFCIHDGSVLSQPMDVVVGTTDEEIETVIRQPKVQTNSDEPSRKAPKDSYKKETDRFIEAAVRKHKTLAFHVNSGREHCVEIIGRESRGSLWVRPRRNGYRVQTTGQAQRLDNYIEDLCGSAVGSAKPQVYQFWYIDSASHLEKIIDRFATFS